MQPSLPPSTASFADDAPHAAAAAGIARPTLARPLLATALACAAAGLVALLLAIPPGYASPLNPASGIALASVLVYGRRMLAAVALGTLAVTAGFLLAQGHRDAAAFAMPVAAALAASLQAGIGALLVRRLVRWPLVLTVPGDVIRFLTACTASSLVAPSIATVALAGLTDMAAAELLFTWATWWIGDLAGLLIVTPIALTLIGRPRSEWAPRRLSVGLTLTLATAFLALGTVQVGRWSDERLKSAFDHDASSASLILVTQLQEPLRALEAMRDVFSVSRELSAAQVKDATENWLGGGAVRSMGWAEHVRRDDIAAFEARARTAGVAEFHVSAAPGTTPSAASSKALAALGLQRSEGEDRKSVV